MTDADELELARAALTMINPAPFNAEAPPRALDAHITATERHYVRSNFAVPAHDGTVEIGGAVGTPTTLTLRGSPRAAGARPGGDAGMCRQRASRHATASDG